MTTLYIENAPPIVNTAYTFYLSLVSQLDTDIFQVNPTLAVGDVKVSINGGALNNVAVLPTAIGAGKLLSVPLSAAEMNGSVINVLFSDVLGNEWQDVLVSIITVSPTNLTLSMSISSMLSALAGLDLEIYRGDTYDLDIVGLGDLTGWTKIWFTVKHDKDDTDAQAIIQIIESNPGIATDGLLYIEGSAPTALANGSITVTNVINGDITIRIEAIETAKLIDCGNFYYDIQYQTATDTITLRRGRCTISGDVTRMV